MAFQDLSQNSGAVERLRVEPVEPKAKLTVVQPQPTAQPTPAPTPSPTPSPYPTVAVLTVLRSIAMVLAIRLQLLWALAGAFILALLAMSQQSYIGLAILAAYCALTVIPLVVLAWPDRQKV